MKRTSIQKAIIPRNWHFGRLAGIRNNLRSILTNCVLTKLERDMLNECVELMLIVCQRKEISNKLIKMDINNEKLKQ